MDNRNPFERQLADEIDYEVGPPRTVDALAITRQAKTMSPRWRSFPMSSAVKFTAAAAVLATAGAAFLLVVPGALTPDDGVPPPGAESQSAPPSQEAESPAVEPTVGDIAPFGWLETGEPEVVDPGTTDDPVAGLILQTGLTDAGHRIDSFEPRVAGVATTVTNGATLGDPDSVAPPFGDDMSAPPPELLVVSSVARQIVNDGGSWSGTGHEIEYMSEDGENLAITSLEILHGEGDYAGLTLILTSDGEQRLGWIVPTTAVQPVPELPAE